ncbi:MAG: septum formation initiator family protein [Candidatus Margulisbacteria bacterium]|nr:septum formation initiator family protein [Candidatus Margulisiibacteriota bacterium]
MKRFGWLLFVLMVIYFIFLIRQDIIDNLELKKDRAAIQKSVETNKDSALGLNDRLARLKSDDLIEELARTKLGLIKKGETAYKVVK